MLGYRSYIIEAKKPTKKSFTVVGNDMLKMAPKALAKTLKPVLKRLPDSGVIFADANWNKTPKAMWMIKTTGGNVRAVQKLLPGGVVNASVYKVKVGDLTLNFKTSGKKLNSGADTGTTQQQELGSAWIIKRAIKDNVKYKKWEDIAADPKIGELIKMFPTVIDNPIWLKTYYAQQKTMLDEFKNAKFNEFNRDGGFMDFISKLVKQKFGIAQKDAWNPADIWLIQNEAAVTKLIKKTMSGPKSTQTIQELNTVLRKLFKDRKIVGISLKKVSGKVARYEEFNVDEVDLGADYKYNVKKLVFNMTNVNGVFGSQDLLIYVEGVGTQYKFQIKGNDSSKFSNLKIEPTAKGAYAARVGKAPLPLVANLFSANGLTFNNDNKKYPKTAEEYLARHKEFAALFNTVKGKVSTGVADANAFKENMVAGYSSVKPQIAQSKLMQLDMFAQLLSLSKDDFDNIMTDTVFIAAKKGDTFGPFGKLF